MATTSRALAPVGHDQVWFAVSIYVSHRDREGFEPTGTIDDRFLEGAVAVAQKHAHRAAIADFGAKVRQNQVRLSVAIDILDCDRPRKKSAGFVRVRFLKGAIAVAKQHAHRI